MWMKKEVLKIYTIKKNHERGGRRDRLSWRHVRGIGSSWESQSPGGADERWSKNIKEKVDLLPRGQDTQ